MRLASYSGATEAQWLDTPPSGGVSRLAETRVPRKRLLVAVGTELSIVVEEFTGSMAAHWMVSAGTPPVYAFIGVSGGTISVTPPANGHYEMMVVDSANNRLVLNIDVGAA